MSSLFVRSCPIVFTAFMLSACSGNKETPAVVPTPTPPTHETQVQPPQNNDADNTATNQGKVTPEAKTEPSQETPSPKVDNQPDQPVVPPVDKPADKPTDNPANPTDNPADNPTDKPTVPSVDKPSEQITPAEPPKPTENVAKEISGFSRQYMQPRVRDMWPYVDPLDTTYVETEKTDNLYTLVVDGQKIDMLPEGAQIGGTIETQGENEYHQTTKKVLHTDLQYVVSGVYTYPTNKPCAADDIHCEDDRDTLASVGYNPNLPKHIYFVQGFETLDMPMSGSAEYEGSGNKFLVDFSEKIVNGNLWSNTFTAKINGNRFATERDPTRSSEEVFSVNGGFFGPNAAEMAGVYNDHDKYIGTFSAKKTEK
ncbi:transferrin-binding protein-like solute binding protein [Aggregatibacter actinomycetemcomitans]|nr:transferrin-binding protein-like solute binding protein [Aggregatibacter actinomycetemcomitans]